MWSQIVHVFKKQFMTKVNTEDKQYVYKEPMSIKEILIGIAEGLAFLFFLGSLILAVTLGCVMIDKCYYFYVPGGF
jgi:hypothetical protein